MPAYCFRTTTHGRNMAGARGLWRATGMPACCAKDGDFGKPIIAIANSFTQFGPGHIKDLGQLVAREIESVGGVAKEFNTIAGAAPRLRQHGHATRSSLERARRVSRSTETVNRSRRYRAKH